MTASQLDDGIEIRQARTQAEYAACYELQLATWGQTFREAVPTTILKVSQRLGGVTAGAFAADGRLLGFVFGMTGVERGEIVHWSDILAVVPDAQNLGLGRRLKAYQRDLVRATGAKRMYWTYDPLVARNAHFNLNRLGARVHEYVPDMYGTDTGSEVHSGLGTDRFIVVWHITARDDELMLPGAVDASDAPILNDGAVDGTSAEPGRLVDTRPRVLRIEVPADIARVQADSVERAAHWRATTRRAFQWAIGAGYTIDRIAFDGDTGRAFYIMLREPPPPATVPTVF